MDWAGSDCNRIGDSFSALAMATSPPEWRGHAGCGERLNLPPRIERGGTSSPRADGAARPPAA